MQGGRGSVELVLHVQREKSLFLFLFSRNFLFSSSTGYVQYDESIGSDWVCLIGAGVAGTENLLHTGTGTSAGTVGLMRVRYAARGGLDAGWGVGNNPVLGGGMAEHPVSVDRDRVCGVECCGCTA